MHHLRGCENHVKFDGLILFTNLLASGGLCQMTASGMQYAKGPL